MSDAVETTILLAGGGTGGHLYPGISVAQALARQMPQAKPVFLCTTREIDRTILAPTGFEFLEQAIVPPKRSIGGLLNFFTSWRETKELVKRVLRERRPAAVLGLGGYAAGVAVKVASQRGIPTAILNPDVVPGKANQYLARYVSVICAQFEVTRDHLSSSQQSKLRVTGCPIREEIRALPTRAEAAARLALKPDLRTLVVTGASQGAASVNDAVVAALAGVKLQGWQILHLSGKDHAGAVRDAYRAADIDAAVIDFTPAMADAWAVADLAVSRAGASSVAELCACGVPSILMPYPFHRDMHQRANAKVLADAGAAVLFDDEKDKAKNAPRLRPVLESLLFDATRRDDMSAAAKSLGKPDAANNVAHVITEMAAVGR
jgi:UDP-N-acetylglucosamine--N-acetylmuramyl-(pentapeptide) pyrophosphoryl-undecaprenol N-acetylglucosamine transferase